MVLIPRLLCLDILLFIVNKNLMKYLKRKKREKMILGKNLLFRLKAQLCEYSFFIKLQTIDILQWIITLLRGNIAPVIPTFSYPINSRPWCHCHWHIFKYKWGFLHQHKGKDDSSFHNWRTFAWLLCGAVFTSFLFDSYFIQETPTLGKPDIPPVGSHYSF